MSFVSFLMKMSKIRIRAEVRDYLTTPSLCGAPLKNERYLAIIYWALFMEYLCDSPFCG